MNSAINFSFQSSQSGSVVSLPSLSLDSFRVGGGGILASNLSIILPPSRDPEMPFRLRDNLAARSDMRSPAGGLVWTAVSPGTALVTSEETDRSLALPVPPESSSRRN